jgi:spermidine synthase
VSRRIAILACLVFSGLTALVYQIIWTRLLGFTFGTSTEAISTVLAIFFGGLALGNLLAARVLARVERPLRVYALLELAIGAFALLSLPLLLNLHLAYGVLGVPSGAGLTATRIGLASLVLLPPTVAMGATLPVVARALVCDDRTRGRWSAYLYTANTAGAVLGAYLCGFWLIPGAGLTHSVLGAGSLNLAVAGCVLWVARHRDFAPDSRPAPVATAPAPRGNALYLAAFGISGFVAIGYEILWSRAFGIVMEGTLYGFAAVLSAYLLGIAIGSGLVARRVDAIRDLPRAFALLHVAIGIAVLAGTAAVPWLPWAHHRLSEIAVAGDAIHLLYVLILPVVVLPTALFGAAFPVLIRLCTPRASGVGRGMGIASAVNTAGSISASFVVGFWWIPEIGADAALYLLLLLDFAVAIVVLTPMPPAGGGRRWGSLAGATLMIAGVAFSFGGVRLEDAIEGRQLRTLGLAEYARGLETSAGSRALTIEGKASIVTVHAAPTARLLRTNGLPEAGFRYAPPHYPREAVLLGLVPWLAAEDPERALVIGLGGGNTLRTLVQTDLPSIEVVELERGVVEAVDVMHRGRRNPLDDPRVALRVADGRNDLLLRNLRGAKGYDLITSQPSHPWRIGAANLFTEDFFRIAHDALSEQGVFAAWLNGFRIDPESMLAVVTSFERVFPGAMLADIGADPHQSFLLLGARRPIGIDDDAARARLAQPRVAALLAPYGIHGLADVMASFEGPASAFAALSSVANTDDNAWVETRVPRILRWQPIDYTRIESRLAPSTPVLPPGDRAIDRLDVGRALLARSQDATYVPKLERLLAGMDAQSIEVRLLRTEALMRDPARADAARSALAGLLREAPGRPEPLRLWGRLAEGAEASEAFAAAFARSGDPSDAWEAGRALAGVDRDAMWRWLERIPTEARARFAELAWFEAERALEDGRRGADVRAVYERLAAYLSSEPGSEREGGHELAMRLAWALGDPIAARRHADRDAAERSRRSERALAHARRALDAGDLPEARAALAFAGHWTPAHEGLLDLATRTALRHGDEASREEALAALRRNAPTRAQGIGAENRLRSLHGMPLLPEHASRP